MNTYACMLRMTTRDCSLNCLPLLKKAVTTKQSNYCRLMCCLLCTDIRTYVHIVYSITLCKPTWPLLLLYPQLAVCLCIQGIETSTLSEKDAMVAFISRLRKLETFGFAFFTITVSLSHTYVRGEVPVVYFQIEYPIHRWQCV